MGQNLSRKILATHLLSGNMSIGEEIAIRIDQTLTHDVTGTQAYLAFETMNVPRVKTELSVSYVVGECGNSKTRDEKFDSICGYNENFR